MERMMLGEYRFNVNTAVYQSKKRTTHYRWNKEDKLGGLPALQFVGLGDDTIDLDGIIYPHYRGGLSQVESMRQEASKGKPLILICGDGTHLGHWVIESIAETETFFAEGIPQKIEFSLKLRCFSAPKAS